MLDPSPRITAMLAQWTSGDQEVFNDLYPLIEVELRRLARYYLHTLRPGHGFQTTLLINEAYIRLVDQRRICWQSRSHFFAIAACMMRRILLNHIRDQKRKKRGGGALHISLEDVAVVSKERSKELIALDDALNRLEEIHERKARVVELRYFGGLGVLEVAEVLGISKITVIRDWKYAKAWLARELANDD